MSLTLKLLRYTSTSLGSKLLTHFSHKLIAHISSTRWPLKDSEITFHIDYY